MTMGPDDANARDQQGTFSSVDMATQPSDPGSNLVNMDEPALHKSPPVLASGEPEAGEIENDPVDDGTNAGQAPSSATTATVPSDTQTAQEVRKPRQIRNPIVFSLDKKKGP